MSAAVHQGQGQPTNVALPSEKTQAQKEVETPIPEIIEERRKDSDGRILVNRFHRGKLLGKVRGVLYLLMNHQRLASSDSLTIAFRQPPISNFSRD